MSQYVCSLCSDSCPQDETLCVHCKEADTFVHQMTGKADCNLCCQMGPRFKSVVFRNLIIWCYGCAVAVTRFALAQKRLLAKQEEPCLVSQKHD